MLSKFRFTTLFPFATNYNITKDVGMIPFFISKKGIHAILVCYKYSHKLYEKRGLLNHASKDLESYSNIEKGGEAEGLKIKFLNDTGFYKYFDFSVILYLIKNAKHIDTLNLFHINLHTFLYTFIFKLIHSRGKVYVKADQRVVIGNKPAHLSRRRIFAKFLRNYFLRHVDLISVETSSGKNYLIELFPILRNKIKIIPNGVNDIFIDKHFPLINPLHTRENIMVTVGRFGDYDKNSELLLRALAKVDLKDWKVYFVGPVLENFKEEIKLFFKENPSKKSHVVFMGSIQDRLKIYEIYNSSKVFCLPSRNEGFPISLVEALYFGNYCLVSSGIGTASEIIPDKKVGSIFKSNDVEDLSLNLHFIFENIKEIEKGFDQIIAYSHANFRYSKISEKLIAELNL